MLEKNYNNHKYFDWHEITPEDYHELPFGTHSSELDFYRDGTAMTFSIMVFSLGVFSF